MANETIISIVASLFGAGGGVIALVSLILKHRNEQQKAHREAKGKDIDDRIAAWQDLFKKQDEQNEKRDKKIEKLERALAAFKRDILAQSNYITELLIKFAKMAQSDDIPERPVLECEKIEQLDWKSG